MRGIGFLFNKLLCLSLIVLFVFMALAVNQAHADLAKSTIISLAEEAVENLLDDPQVINRYPLTECVYESDGENDYWIVSFVGEYLEEYDFNAYVVKMQSDGELVQITKPTKKNPITISFFDLVKKKGMFVTWDYQEKYDYSIEWRKKLEEWDAHHPDDEVEVWSYIRYILGINYSMPLATDITETQAEKIAFAALLNAFPSEEKNITNCLTYYSFICNGDDERVWRVFFIPKDRDEAAKNGDYGYYVFVAASDGRVMDLVHQIRDNITVDTYHMSLYE